MEMLQCDTIPCTWPDDTHEWGCGGGEGGIMTPCRSGDDDPCCSVMDGSTFIINNDNCCKYFLLSTSTIK